MKRLFTSLLPIPIIALTAWLGGYDFDTRSFGVAYVFICTIFACVIVYAFPGWNSK